jgi:molybdate transport system ATP-binding protein
VRATAAVTHPGDGGTDQGTAGLAADVRLRRGEVEIGARLRVGRGETVALLGPNGAGKTSLLRAVAGLVPLEAGTVRVDGVDWERTPGGRRLPAEARSVGFVFQDYLLLPHLSALDNVAYGLRRRGRSRAAARAGALAWLERLGVADRAGHRPGELSGGQQQRVALARALAPGPSLLLLDEPLAALDVTTRREVRGELRAHLAAFEGASLLVSHDPLDAMVLADRIVVVEEGRVVQEGTAVEVTSRPRSAFAADIAGLNLFRGEARAGVVEVSPSLRVVAGEAVDGAVFAAVHPRSIALHLEEPRGSARNVWSAVVDEVDLRGGLARLRLQVGDQAVVAEITAASCREMGLDPGTPVWASLKATEVEVFPA